MSQGQENCGEQGNNSWINSSVCLKRMAGFCLHRFVLGSFFATEHGMQLRLNRGDMGIVSLKEKLLLDDM